MMDVVAARRGAAGVARVGISVMDDDDGSGGAASGEFGGRGMLLCDGSDHDGARNRSLLAGRRTLRSVTGVGFLDFR